MLLLKRLVTACFCFILFSFISFVAICATGGLIAGVANHGDSEAAKQAATLFVKDNAAFIVLSSLIFALVSSSWLSFFGILPWCKEKTSKVEKNIEDRPRQNIYTTK